MYKTRSLPYGVGIMSGISTEFPALCVVNWMLNCRSENLKTKSPFVDNHTVFHLPNCCLPCQLYSSGDGIWPRSINRIYILHFKAFKWYLDAFKIMKWYRLLEEKSTTIYKPWCNHLVLEVRYLKMPGASVAIVFRYLVVLCAP